MILEKKVTKGAAVGGGVGIAAAFVIWALTAYVPAFRTGVPEPVVAVLPFALGWLGHTIAAWHAPHTPRPDLPSPPAGGPPA